MATPCTCRDFSRAPNRTSLVRRTARASRRKTATSAPPHFMRQARDERPCRACRPIIATESGPGTGRRSAPDKLGHLLLGVPDRAAAFFAWVGDLTYALDGQPRHQQRQKHKTRVWTSKKTTSTGTHTLQCSRLGRAATSTRRGTSPMAASPSTALLQISDKNGGAGIGITHVAKIPLASTTRKAQAKRELADIQLAFWPAMRGRQGTP